MKKRFLTADVIRAHYADGYRQLSLEPNDVLTPLANDTARELGVAVIHGGQPVKEGSNGSGKPDAVPPSAATATAPPATETDTLEPLIRKVVMACLMKINPGSVTPETLVKRVGAQSYEMQPFPFEINRPEMDVRLVDVITADHGSPIAAGFLSFHKGSFPWTLTYDEIEFVLEGEIHIGTAQGTVVGKPGDVLYIPKGTQITFGTPGWAKILYVTYPAEWAG